MDRMSRLPHTAASPSLARSCAAALLAAGLLLACSEGGSPQAGPETGASDQAAAEAPPAEDGPPDELAAYELAPGQSLDVVEGFYPDGKPLLRREVLRDADGMVNHGRFQRWHANGAVAELGWYLEGRKHGTYLQVAETGLKLSEVRYDRGRRQGLSLTWNEMGQLKRRAHFSADQLDGEYELYAGGEIKERGRYAAGVEEGPWTYWFAGVGKAEEGSYEAGQREGLWRSWHTSGALRAEETFHGGVLDGPAVEYDEEGRRIAERSYQDGVPDGLQVEYHPDGTVQSEARYTAGRLEGLQRRWYPDGTLQVEGTMRDGKREGRWTYYDPDGAINEAWSGEYRNDERVSG
jgi:antitoxin component YwqK of YwqJK toxin-antitoxin module